MVSLAEDPELFPDATQMLLADALARAEEALDAAVKADPKNRRAYIEEVDTFVPDFLEELVRGSIKEVLTVWEAFAGFCEEELGLEPEKLLEAYLEPTWPGIERLKDIVNNSDACEKDPEESAECREYFRRVWIALVKEV
jgi:hypothetical protein